MGITGLLPCLRGITKNVHLKEFSGQKVAVDGYVWLHRGVYSCSTELCLGQKTDKYIQYCVGMVQLLLANGVIPIVVFDGDRLPAKAVTEQQRRRNRELCLERGRDYQKNGNLAAADDCFKKAVDITPVMAKNFILQLQQMGVEFIVAPYEADAQMAYLAISNMIEAVVTEDSDLLVYGCPKVIFKLNKDGFGKQVCIADLPKNQNPPFSMFTHQMFIEMCILSGCDFLPSIRGIGITRAHQQIRTARNFVKAVKQIKLKGIGVPADYLVGVQLAIWVFKHQRVYCPQRKQLVHLQEIPARGLIDSEMHVSDALPQGVQAVTLDFLGPPVDDFIVQKVAQGELDPVTKCQFNWEDIIVPESGKAVVSGTARPSGLRKVSGSGRSKTQDPQQPILKKWFIPKKSNENIPQSARCSRNGTQRGAQYPSPEKSTQRQKQNQQQSINSNLVGEQEYCTRNENSQIICLQQTLLQTQQETPKMKYKLAEHLTNRYKQNESNQEANSNDALAGTPWAAEGTRKSSPQQNVTADIKNKQQSLNNVSNEQKIFVENDSQNTSNDSVAQNKKSNSDSGECIIPSISFSMDFSTMSSGIDEGIYPIKQKKQSDDKMLKKCAGEYSLGAGFAQQSLELSSSQSQQENQENMKNPKDSFNIFRYNGNCNLLKPNKVVNGFYKQTLKSQNNRNVLTECKLRTENENLESLSKQGKLRRILQQQQSQQQQEQQPQCNFDDREHSIFGDSGDRSSKRRKLNLTKKPVARKISFNEVNEDCIQQLPEVIQKQSIPVLQNHKQIQQFQQQQQKGRSQFQQFKFKNSKENIDNGDVDQRTEIQTICSSRAFLYEDGQFDNIRHVSKFSKIAAKVVRDLQVKHFQMHNIPVPTTVNEQQQHIQNIDQDYEESDDDNIQMNSNQEAGENGKQASCSKLLTSRLRQVLQRTQEKSISQERC